MRADAISDAVKDGGLCRVGHALMLNGGFEIVEGSEFCVDGDGRAFESGEDLVRLLVHGEQGHKPGWTSQQRERGC